MPDTPHDASLYACLYQPPSPGAAGVRGAGSSDTPRDGASDPAEYVGQRHTQAGAAPALQTDSAPRTEVSPLLAIAAGFSPRYEQHRADLVSIDVRGLSRLLGSPRAIGEELRRDAASRGIRVHVAVAPTCTAALVLALARPGLTVIARGGESAALAPVPIGVLEQVHEVVMSAGSAGRRDAGLRPRGDAAQAVVSMLRRWGLRTLGELAVLPAADLSARLGRGGAMWQAIARGEDTRPLVPLQAEERFEATLELEWPIEGAEPLSFVLTRLLEPLSTRLERRDRGAAVLYVALHLVTREVHACRLELPSPLREVRALRTLALLDLESHPPTAAIDRVTVTIEPTPGRILQHALFTRPHPTPEQLSTLLARLGALMGLDRVGAPAVVDTDRPGAFAMTPFAIEPAPASSAQLPPFRVQPPLPDPRLVSAVRRCRQPVPARVAVDESRRPIRVSTDRRGFAGGAVVSSAGPWRTSGAWWEDDTDRGGQTAARGAPGMGADKDNRVHGAAGGRGMRGPWSRDEWDVALADGAVYRVFRDRRTDGWFIDGVLD